MKKKKVVQKICEDVWKQKWRESRGEKKERGVLRVKVRGEALAA